MDACLSCPGTPQGEGRHGGVEPCLAGLHRPLQKYPGPWTGASRSMTMYHCMCNSVETAQPGDRTTNPCIVMPECYASSQRVDSLARVVITPVRHTHTRLHTPLSNICSSPSSIQHTRGLNSSICLHTSCIFTTTVLQT